MRSIRNILGTKSALVLLAIAVVSSVLVSFTGIQPGKFHTAEELRALRGALRNLPVGSNNFFAGSGLCNGCHGHDNNNYALLNANGVDVNIADDWAGSMMANASKDPFWRAKVSHEILINPSHQDAIENTCTRCHAPIGKFNALYSGVSDYNISDMINDSLALDGVSCGACHQIKDTLIAKLFSGQMIYDTTHTIYGPYQTPFAGPMQSFIGFDPVYSTHINRAGLCGGCHTLITSSLDLTGNPTGTDFVEQATYHEWVNSDFNDEANPNGISCQGCHIPRIDDKVVISGNYSFLDGRKPFGMHHLVGANSFMLNLMRNNMGPVGITCQPKSLDSAIARTNRMMQDSAVVMNLVEKARVNDTVYYNLSLTNNAGHKFPSGYPSRRAWIEFVVLDDTGDTLFKNGIMDSNYEIIGEDPTYEPHYNVINSETQVQIYQMVMGDVNGNVTTVLERAYSHLKDNRLTPRGFTTSHYAYDTTEITGSALTDPDFNKNGAVEGTGRDTVHFHIPLNGYMGNLNVSVKLYYQSIPHRFVQDMFAQSSAEISFFQSLFNAADHTPLLVAAIKTGNLFAGTPDIEEEIFGVYPNPTQDNKVYLQHADKITSIEVFDLSGRTQPVSRSGNQLMLPGKGTYIIRVRTGDKFFTLKIISL